MRLRARPPSPIDISDTDSAKDATATTTVKEEVAIILPTRLKGATYTWDENMGVWWERLAEFSA